MKLLEYPDGKADPNAQIERSATEIPSWFDWQRIPDRKGGIGWKQHLLGGLG